MGKPSVLEATPQEIEALSQLCEERTILRALPRIDVTHHDLVEQTKLAWEAIQQANQSKPFLFRRGTIVRIERTEKDSLVVREVTTDRMRHAIAPLVSWFKPQTGTLLGVPALPPTWLVRNLLATPNPPLPALLRIVEAPVFTA